MDYLTELGSLALGSRLKRISERISHEVSTIYEKEGISFEPRWFPVFHLLGNGGKASIVEIAKEIGVTHPAVNQIAKEMLQEGLLNEVVDKSDKRKRLLSLSTKGKNMHANLRQTWQLIRIAVNEAMEESEQNLLAAIKSTEETLDKTNLAARFENTKTLFKARKIELIEFESRYREQFRTLNEAWIQKYFALEAADKQTLGHPEEIIAGGGMIFFAKLGEKVIGTCALIKTNANTYELAKMAVSEDFRGLGAGQKLLEGSIEWSRKQGASSITLETNKKLESAVVLYKKFGFKPIDSSTAAKSKYVRVDLMMTLDLVC